MKIESLGIKDYPPLKNFHVEKLGNMVIVAGANGSGKTKLKEALVQTLGGNPVMHLKLRATRANEKDSFGGDFIEVKQGESNQILNKYMNQRRGFGQYVGSLVQIDSQRNIQTTTYNPVNFLVSDPDDQETDPYFYQQAFSNRWQQLMDNIHKKVAAHKNKLADAMSKNPNKNCGEVLDAHSHPLDKYKKLFKEIFPDKELRDINPANPQAFQYNYTDNKTQAFSFQTLSSGEQEIVKILFDITHKEIRHSVIIIDEPDLHLHPALTFKLVETLKSTGQHTNQFIFLTHSADLISTYYSTGNVYFIDANRTDVNQAYRLSDLDQNHGEVVKLMNDNLGLFAVGKKLVFIEGEHSSADRLVYHAIAQVYMPTAKIIPVGSVNNITALNTLERQIRKAIFGIDLYMIRDRDGLSKEQANAIEERGRIKCLPRRHIENYFLDAELLFQVAKRLCLTAGSSDLSPALIKEETKRIAETTMGYTLLQNTRDYLAINYCIDIGTVSNLDGKAINDVQSEILAGFQASLQRLSQDYSPDQLESWIDGEKMRLQAEFRNGNWISSFHGKTIFGKLCGNVLKENSYKVRQAYVEIAMEQKPEVFEDIKIIFKSFFS